MSVDEIEKVPLKEFLCQKIIALEQKVELHLRLNAVALDKAQVQMEERLARMNEFRDALKDQAGRFVTREEIGVVIEVIKTDIKALREAKAVLEGKASASSVYWAYAIAIVGVVVSIIALVVKAI